MPATFRPGSKLLVGRLGRPNRWNNDGRFSNTDRWFLANNLQDPHVVELLGYTPRKAKADLYLSFHMNTNPDTTLSGSICYRSTQVTAATYEAQSTQFCKRILDAVAALAPGLPGGSHMPSAMWVSMSLPVSLPGGTCTCTNGP